MLTELHGATPRATPWPPPPRGSLQEGLFLQMAPLSIPLLEFGGSDPKEWGSLFSQVLPQSWRHFPVPWNQQPGLRCSRPCGTAGEGQLPVQLPARAPGKAAEDGPSAGSWSQKPELAIEPGTQRTGHRCLHQHLTCSAKYTSLNLLLEIFIDLHFYLKV